MQRCVSIETLDRCDSAVFLVAADGVLVYANRHAELLLADGRTIGQRNGRLTALRNNESSRLSGLIREAACLTAARGADGIMVLRGVNHHPLSVLVAPFRMLWSGHPAAGPCQREDDCGNRRGPWRDSRYRPEAAEDHIREDRD